MSEPATAAAPPANAAATSGAAGTTTTAAQAAQPGGDRDSRIATDMVRAVRALNEVLDTAIKAGLIVEPAFNTATNRFDDLGISTQSYIASVKVYRKLC